MPRGIIVATMADDTTGVSQNAVTIDGGGTEDLEDRVAFRALGNVLDATAIERGDVLIFDLTTTGFTPGKTVMVSGTTDDAPQFAGVANKAQYANANGDDFVEYVYKGYVARAKCTASVNAAGLLLQVSNTAESFEAAFATTERGVAVSLAAVDGNGFAPVRIL